MLIMKFFVFIATMNGPLRPIHTLYSGNKFLLRRLVVTPTNISESDLLQTCNTDKWMMNG